ncbi:hypothetical protein LEP3755_12200 [Leptolyngbya sp. NIES-3755]|nr:hypothetical protein LEP3755_12200 [Leptolyngbya sp. NIES-3755]
MSAVPPIPPQKVELRRSITPIAYPVAPAGFCAPARTLSHRSQKEHNLMAAMVGTVLKDPLLMRQLSDRVYELMQEELMRDRDRYSRY